MTDPTQMILPSGGGGEMAHCALACEVKKLDIAERTVDVIMSTPAIDRHGERVELDWELRSFKANPVVLWAHDSRDLPLGRCENVRIEGQALVGTIRFCSAAANPKAEQCLQLFREGVLNAVSVGFIPHSYRFEKDDDEEVLVMSQNELVELSVTPCPANPEALVRRRQKALAMRAIDVANEARAADPALNAVIATAAKQLELIAPSQPTNECAERGATESSMDLKEATEKLEKSEKALIDSKASEKQLTDRAEKAEKALADASREIAEAATKLAAFDAQSKALVARAETAEKKVSDLEAKLFEQEVDGLVGKKIAAAEKATFLKLLKQDRTLFDEMIAQRAPMKLEESITEAGAAKNGTPATSSDTSDLARELFG